MSDSPELLKPDTEVTDTGLQVELQTKICNLESENETLKQELRSASRRLAERDKELNRLHERNGDLDLEAQNLGEELAAVKRDRDETRNSTPIAIGVEFPEAADLLNQLKARRKKSKADLADVEAILEMMKKSTISVGD